MINYQGWRTLLESLDVGHWIRVIDITDGPNGFHPHLHVALALPAGIASEPLADLESSLSHLWRCTATEKGFAFHSSTVAVAISPTAWSAEDLAWYLTKGIPGIIGEFHHRMTNGDQTAHPRWRQYLKAMYRKTLVTRSQKDLRPPRPVSTTEPCLEPAALLTPDSVIPVPCSPLLVPPAVLTSGLRPSARTQRAWIVASIVVLTVVAALLGVASSVQQSSHRPVSVPFPTWGHTKSLTCFEPPGVLGAPFDVAPRDSDALSNRVLPKILDVWRRSC